MTDDQTCGSGHLKGQELTAAISDDRRRSAQEKPIGRHGLSSPSAPMDRESPPRLGQHCACGYHERKRDRVLRGHQARSHLSTSARWLAK